jgi:hypothetical protein
MEIFDHYKNVKKAILKIADMGPAMDKKKVVKYQSLIWVRSINRLF